MVKINHVSINDKKLSCYAVIQEIEWNKKIVILVHGGIEKSTNINEHIEEMATLLYFELWGDKDYEVKWYDCEVSINENNLVGVCQELFFTSSDNVFSKAKWGKNIIEDDSQDREKIIEAYNYMLKRIKSIRRNIKVEIGIRKNEELKKSRLGFFILKFKGWINKLRASETNW